MSFVQYTECVEVEDKALPINPTPLVVVSAITMVVIALFVSLYAAIPFLGIIIMYCRWWLYDRLICLGGDRCAIGLLGGVETPGKKKGFDKFDTDYSINLLLAPHQPQELPKGFVLGDGDVKEAMHRQIADDGLQGVLIKETATTAGRYSFTGYFSKIPSQNTVSNHQPYLHCEFEGAGVYKLMVAAELALAFATAAAVACLVPVIGWVVCVILGAIAGAISLAGLIVALSDEAEPSVYDAKTGETSNVLHTMRDILFVRGAWVFDTAHEGWNEIHPIKFCQRIATAPVYSPDGVDWHYAIASYLRALHRWDLDFSDPLNPKPIMKDGPPKPQDWIDWVKSWCDLADTARHPSTLSNQQRPENRWRVHPAVDGGRIAQPAAGFIG